MLNGSLTIHKELSSIKRHTTVKLKLVTSNPTIEYTFLNSTRPWVIWESYNNIYWMQPVETNTDYSFWWKFRDTLIPIFYNTVISYHPGGMRKRFSVGCTLISTRELTKKPEIWLYQLFQIIFELHYIWNLKPEIHEK